MPWQRGSCAQLAWRKMTGVQCAWFHIGLNMEAVERRVHNPSPVSSASLSPDQALGPHTLVLSAPGFLRMSPQGFGWWLSCSGSLRPSSPCAPISLEGTPTFSGTLSWAPSGMDGPIGADGTGTICGVSGEGTDKIQSHTEPGSPRGKKKAAVA